MRREGVCSVWEGREDVVCVGREGGGQCEGECRKGGCSV